MLFFFLYLVAERGLRTQVYDNAQLNSFDYRKTMEMLPEFLRIALEHQVLLVEKRKNVNNAKGDAKIKAMYILADEYGLGINFSDLMLQITQDSKLRNSKYASRAWLHVLKGKSDKNVLAIYLQYLHSIKKATHTDLIDLFKSGLQLAPFAEEEVKLKYYLNMAKNNLIDKTLIDAYEDFVLLSFKDANIKQIAEKYLKASKDDLLQFEASQARKRATK